MSTNSVCTKSSLLLGMVYSKQDRPTRGQEYRDRVRCEAMENIGYHVRTLDDKHDDSHLEKHCQANFSDTRRMLESMKVKWERISFDFVILDYFFSPVTSLFLLLLRFNIDEVFMILFVQVGWARHRWTDPLFTATFPNLAKDGHLAKGCQIWLPNIHCIEVSLCEFHNNLIPFYTIRKEKDPKMNPLFLATEQVEDKLLMCPDALTNVTQLRPILEFSNEPFYVLELRGVFLEYQEMKEEHDSSYDDSANDGDCEQDDDEDYEQDEEYQVSKSKKRRITYDMATEVLYNAVIGARK